MTTIRTLAAVAVLLSISAPATASAVMIVGGTNEPPPPPRLQRWADTSLVPTPAVTVTVHMSSCPFYPDKTACAAPGEIWFAPGSSRHDFRHELGHQFDYFEMTDSARAAFMKLIGVPGEWRSAPNSPHEQFAEAWRMCAAVRRLPLEYWTGYGYDLTQRKHNRACALIRNVAAP